MFSTKLKCYLSYDFNSSVFFSFVTVDLSYNCRTAPVPLLNILCIVGIQLNIIWLNKIGQVIELISLINTEVGFQVSIKE